MGGEDERPAMPVVSYGTWLVTALWNIGPINTDGSAVSWQEIDAWNRATKRELSGWELETLRKMSEAYAVMSVKARDPACQAPWQTIKLSSSTLNNRILSIFRPLVQQKPAPKIEQAPVKTGKKKRAPSG